MRLILAAAVAGLLTSAAPVNPALVTYRAHGPIHQIIDFSQPGTLLFGTTPWFDVPGFSLKLVIPSGTSQLVMARFTASARCSGPTIGSGCFLRIMAGNAAMLPNPDDSAFQTVTAGENPNTAGAAADRSIVLHPGTYTIKVQVQVLDDNTTLYLIGSHLTVQTADYGAAPGTMPDQKDSDKHPIIGR